MQTGISTSSLFTRMFTEDSLEFLSKNNVNSVEVFLESFCEYNKEFGQKLKKYNYGSNINSIHVLTTQYEPQLYSQNVRAREDSFKILENVLKAGKELGAKNYTFHGSANFKKLPFKIDFDRHALYTQKVIDLCKSYNINLAYENVHWGYYNYVGFFNELRKRTNGLKATLDIKQARLSGYSYKDYINDMKEDIVTVHISDVNKEGKMCLPGRGDFDFKDLFNRLNDVGFNGAVLIESYTTDFDKNEELFESLNYITDLSKTIFGINNVNR